MRPVRVGLVTVTYNSAAVIDDFMRSVLQQTHSDFLLLVVDNQSADDTLARVLEYADPRIRIIQNGANLGFAAGCNIGIRAALDDHCSHLLIINNDTKFSEDLLSKLLAAEAELGSDITVPKICWQDEPNRIWAAGGGFNRLRGCASFHFGENELDSAKYGVTRRVEFAPGCCMLIRSEVIDKVGYFDERYFVYTEDADYCWRAGSLGVQIWYTPDVCLLHRVSALTGGAKSPFVSRYTTRNRVLFMRKHLPWYVAGPWLLVLQLLLHWRLFSGQESWARYRIRQRAFWDGMRVPLKIGRSQGTRNARQAL